MSSSDFIIKDGVLLRYTGQELCPRVPDEVTEIGSSAFFSCGIEGVILPRGLRRIRFHAFYDCAGLRELKLPDGLIEIGDKAFKGCTALENLYVPESVSDIGENPLFACGAVPGLSGIARLTEGCICFGDTLVSYTGDERQFTVPSFVRKIAGYAFCGCKSLQELVIGENIAEIDDFAFANCVKLRTIDFRCEAPVMGPCIFFNCPNLTWIKVLPKMLCPGPLDRQTMCDREFMRLCCVSCLKDAARFSAEQIAEFEAFMIKEKALVMKRAVEADDVFAVLFYIDRQLLSKEECSEYLELCSRLGRAELAARLLSVLGRSNDAEQPQSLTDILGEF